MAAAVLAVEHSAHVGEASGSVPKEKNGGKLLPGAHCILQF